MGSCCICLSQVACVAGPSLEQPIGIVGSPAAAMRMTPTAPARWWWPWIAGVVAGAALVGPGLAPGSLLALDLVLTPELPVPSAVWGLGPDLPQRVPFGVPLAWLATAVGGPTAGKALLVACVAVAFAGAARLAVGAPVVARAGAGLLYAAGPYVATRLAAGHLNVLVAAAVLPWVVPTLLRPGTDLRRTFLAAAAIGFAGPPGGAMAAVAVAVGLVADRGHRAARVTAVAAAGQAPWVVPSLVAWWGSGVAVAGAEAFGTRVDGPPGLLRLAVGAGFWRPSSQVGGSGALAAVVAAAVLGLAVAGARRLPAAYRGRSAALAATGAVVAVASGVPGLRDLAAAVTDLPPLAPFRETHRLVALTLVWLAPAAAIGAGRLAAAAPRWRDVALTVPLAAALVLAGPGWWGAGGRLEPVDFPPSWAEARRVVAARPGPVLALPWHQYLDLGFAGGRRTLNPLPDYLGGDVLRSSDPELGEARQEQVDRRVEVATALVEDIVHGRPTATALAELGVRWVVLAHEADWRSYAALDDDPGLRAVRTGALDLWEVEGWPGPDTVEGPAPRLDPIVAPLWRADGGGPATWHRPSAPGWRRGTEPAGVTPDGNLALPAASGPVWYWPALPCVLALAGVVLAVALVGRRVAGSGHERAGSADAKEGTMVATARATGLPFTESRHSEGRCEERRWPYCWRSWLLSRSPARPLLRPGTGSRSSWRPANRSR